MRIMSSRFRLTTTGIAAAALAAALTGCGGGSTVEGQAPEISSGTEDSSSSSKKTSTTFGQERPEKPTGPVSPPPPPPAPEDAPDPAAEHDNPEAGVPAPGEPGSEPAPEPIPGAGDFLGLLGQQGVVLPEGMDPVATATEACGRFDNGQQMVDVSGWLGEHAQLDPEHQGFFLGAAVGTYCPQNFSKMG